MSYEILSDELYESSEDKKKPKKKTLFSSIKINPLYIHTAIIFIIILGILLYIGMNLTTPSKENQNSITLIGDLSSFEKEFIGNLSLEAQEFSIEGPNLKLEGTSKEIEIKNFNGSFYLENETFFIQGKAQYLSYGNNQLNLNNQNFSLSSFKTTQLSVFFTDLSLDFKEARIMLDEVLNYEFKEGIITLEEFNTTFTYDGTFSFYGIPATFNLNAPQDKLAISYNK